MPYPPSSTSTGSSTAIVLYPDPAFILLCSVLALFVGMYVYMRMQTKSQRALAGFMEATSVDIVFLLVSVVLVVYLFYRFPTGNLVAASIAKVILDGYWLTFAIPIVTVGNSIHHSTRGALAWRDSSIGLSCLLFFVFFYFAYTGVFG
ncbi:MAG: hypothetical protein M1144_06570 [Candidatus Thermoplasmatota archaeon]|jgi:hypothetical protein|nr:hypothetical protein [Candidatus Thermoplasmatota archaeon]